MNTVNLKYRPLVSCLLFVLAVTMIGCTSKTSTQPNKNRRLMSEQQVSFSEKNHALDNNDNFSPDDRFLCYDTRGTVFNSDLANCQSIEKIELATGKETVLWMPESVTGEQAAPGVAAVSWHPSENKVAFIHGPMLNEVEERGYYGIRNRNGAEVSADGAGHFQWLDKRAVATDRPTISGAHRGGTHRHEYSKDGLRIGFTYDDFLCLEYDRTIGYMEPNLKAPKGASHYFAVLLKPAQKGKSKAGEIERAFGDSWLGRKGTMRAFVGKVRAENGRDYQQDLFVADVPENIVITTAYSGDATHFPEPPKGVSIRRLTHAGGVSGIVRGSADGRYIAYLAKDKSGINQLWIIVAEGSDQAMQKKLLPHQVSSFRSDASDLRWHPSGNWIFCLVDGNLLASYVQQGPHFGKAFWLTDDSKQRSQLVVSNNGQLVAYNMEVDNGESDTSTSFLQIFTLQLDLEKLEAALSEI